MTSEELPKILPIPMPFARDVLEEPYSFIKNNDDGGDSALSFSEGFAARFASAGSNGRFVTREMMNALGFLASANDYARLCGKIFTFDPVVCTAIGGYARGAVLDYISGTDYFKVMSLRDNNFVDFTSSTDTSKFPGITNGSVDGNFWQFMNRELNSVADLIAEIPTGSWYSENQTGSNDSVHAVIPIGAGIIPKTGFLTTVGSMNWIGRGFDIDISSGSFSAAGQLSVSITLNPGEENVTQKSIIVYNSNMPDGDNTVTTIVPVTQGTPYVIQLAAFNCEITSSDMKIYVK